MISIWHNPRCGTSRRALALLESHGVAPVIRRYLEEPPTVAELRAALVALNLPAGALLRRKEPLVAELGLAAAGEEALIAAMAAHPILIERPVIFSETRAVLARPAERALEVLAP